MGEAGGSLNNIRECLKYEHQCQMNDVDILVHHAEAYILDEQYDQALKDYQKAHKKPEKLFIDTAAAKEILTDSEKHAKFDNGEDLLNAEEQAQQGGFNPFGGGNGGGFTFRFHFN
ncbi:unnamed protein product [Didymodactylos carnosus]|uniref:Uncharacterized protein n=1 Tax=Didymodactylos carnosus TaxID=1234261 RepID=A0A813VGY6_9BILA|nr:unnamed protein product [Didymodactylos carnosus]CAF0837513.1 unnamed protein product [Didymodactylos carnosus]CAF3508131.1 unnamed protein product [Didymodactylos carnosus]CAF3624767.1 unnamed protein product [Didymodactylos carnosus]